MVVPVRLIFVLPVKRYAVAAMFWSSWFDGGIPSSLAGLTSVPWMLGLAVQPPLTQAGEPLISILSREFTPNCVVPQTLMLSLVWNGPSTSSSASNWISVQEVERSDRYLAQLSCAQIGSE